MAKHLKLVTAIMLTGLVLTAGSLFINRTQPFPDCQSTAMQKGWPLPIVYVQPSVSLCNDVRLISILWEGNAYHEKYYSNLIADYLIWTGLAFMVTGGVIYIRTLRHGTATP